MKEKGDMKITHKRSRYQAGSLTIESRTNGPDVWIFRWREPIGNGKTAQRKFILGTVKQLNKTQAQKKATQYQQQANTPQGVNAATSLTVAELVDHYKEKELGEGCGKAAKVVKAYRSIFANYIVPKWGSLPLGAVKAVAVETRSGRWTKPTARRPRFGRCSALPFGTPCAMSCTRRTRLPT
jgi:integrase